MLGLGGASFVRFLRHHYPDAALTVVEKDAACVRLAQAYFGLADDDPHIELINGDARDVVPGLSHRYDLVMFDLFLAYGPPEWLREAEIFRACRARLSRSGVLSANLWADPDDDDLVTAARGVPGLRRPRAVAPGERIPKPGGAGFRPPPGSGSTRRAPVHGAKPDAAVGDRHGRLARGDRKRESGRRRPARHLSPSTARQDPRAGRASLAQVSRRVTVRLNTGAPGCPSTLSTQK